MSKSLKDRLIEALIENKLITQKQLDHSREVQVKEGGSLSRILVKEGFLSEKDLMAIMSQELRIPAINLSRYKIEKDCVNLIPEAMARQYRVIAICRLAETLIVAMSDPLNIFAIDDLKMLTKFNIEPVLSTETDILDTIDKAYDKEAKPLSEVIKDTQEQNLEFVAVEKEEFDLNEAVLEGETPPIVKIVNLIIAEALRKRASDIHVESAEDGLRVRYRIDGNLYDTLSLPKKNQNAVLARLKIMSGMNITESRIPQDGRFKIRINKKEVDFRVSILPTSFGGKMVLRALDKSNLSVGLDTLGFSTDSLSRFKEAIARPFGMMLVTGPTGSGKSTTLYSIINQMNTSDKNIITIEDPVEYQVEGVTQIQVNSDICLTFANGLRSLLRQSPDIIMVGEIRDS